MYTFVGAFAGALRALPISVALAFVGVVTLAGRAAAQVAEPPPVGVEVGAHAAYARALGSRVGGERFEDTVDGSWPLAIDIGYRLTPRLYLGGLVSYAPLDLDKTHLGCNREVVDGPGDCSGWTGRLAFEAQWRVVKSSYAAWIAAGAGLERVTINFASGCFDGRFKRVDTGFELGRFEFGVGVPLDPRLVVGAFVNYSVGYFRTSETSGSCRSIGSDIPDKAAHGTAMWGLRVMYTVR